MNGVQIVHQAGETQLVFEPALDVAHARKLYHELDEVLAEHQPLTLDASHVERIDAATLQLIAAFCCAARDAGVPVRWSAASTVLRDAAALLDLLETLGRPS
jgi:anti-anti-sigma regulatory factor